MWSRWVKGLERLVGTAANMLLIWLVIILVATIGFFVWGHQIYGRNSLALTQVTVEQIAAAEKEFAGAEWGDLVQLGNQILAFDVEVGHEYRFRNVSCDYRMISSEDLVREKTKLLKNADTPEFNAAARQFLKGN